MPTSVTFVMGKKEAYFFNSPTHWAWHNLPPEVEALFTKTPAIQDVIEFALGENQAYFVSYRDHDGQVLAKHYNLPNALTSFLYNSQPSIVRDLTTLSITLGPYDSYYAWDVNTASWSNLPPKLEKSVLNRLEDQDAWRTSWKANGAEAPSFVSLGADGAYWMRTVCGGGCWDLKPNAAEGMEGIRGINKFLEESSNFSGIAGLHLFPSHPNAYILLKTDGKSFSNLPECTWVDYNKMAPALPCSVQTMQPIPPIPQQRLVQQQQPQQQHTPQIQTQARNGFAQQQQQQQQQQTYNCCPPTHPNGPHNCCPPPLTPQPVHSAQTQPFSQYSAAPVYASGSPGVGVQGNGYQQSGYVNASGNGSAAYGGQGVYR